jgi:hypothetical protein
VTAARACAQTLPQAGAGRSQPRSSAGHSSALRSPSQPGSSVQRTGTQRARPRTIAGTSSGACVVAVAPGALSSGAAGGAEGSGGRLLQAASATRIAAADQRCRCAIVAFGAFEGSRLVMWVILLEALGALVLLVAIVWWTMFAGRKRGERRAGGHDDNADDASPR